MNKIFWALCLALLPCLAWGQGIDVRSMTWGKDYKLHVKMGNDSVYVMDVRALYHQGDLTAEQALTSSTTYLPVTLDREFVDYLKQRPLRDTGKANGQDSVSPRQFATLWSALHSEIGGDYVHLINSIVYALESRRLHLQDEALRRPVTDWKPDPPTDTYKRTKDWPFYVPITQKDAHREYKLRAKEGTLQDLQGIPTRFIDFFLATSDGDYRELVHARQMGKVAQVDLVRMMLGAKYLGERQIEYVSRCVRSAVTHYSASNLPSVIVFDDYKAAVAMTLDAGGYRVDYVVFQDQQLLSPAEVAKREADIRALVKSINEANAKIFRQRLSKYYEQ